MKKSNLIILILLLLFPAGMLIHNLALRAAYPNAKVQPMEQYQGDQRYYRKLPPYHHIVVEGGVRLRSIRTHRINIYNVQTEIRVGPDNSYGLEYRSDVKRFLKTEIRNDTLYCWFEADNSRDWKMVVRSYRELSIRAPKISSIQADSINLDILQLDQPAPVSVQFTNMNVANIHYLDVPLLNLKGERTYMHISGGKTDTLRYELGNEAYLTVNNGLVIGRKELVKAAPHSSFSISGIPADSAMLNK